MKKKSRTPIKMDLKKLSPKSGTVTNKNMVSELPADETLNEKMKRRLQRKQSLIILTKNSAMGLISE